MAIESTLMDALFETPWWESLQDRTQTNDNELDYLQELVNLRSKKREKKLLKGDGYVSPSVIIDDFLYQGQLKHANNKNLLTDLNIRHILNVSDCPLERSILDHFDVLWINVNDVAAVDVSQYFEKTNEFLNSCKAKDEKVLVHCLMGISRSSTIILAYLLRYYHNSLTEAYDYLLERRRCVDPNRSFFLQLIRYERKLREQQKINDRQNMNKRQSSIDALDTNERPELSANP